MKFEISSIFPEPGIVFNVSYKVRKLISEYVNEDIVEEIELGGDFNEFRLGIIISTESSLKDFKVKGPDISKKFKSIDYAVWIPYSEVVNSNKMLEIYINYVFKGIHDVFLKEKIDVRRLDEIRELVKKKVLNNLEYTYLGS